MKKNCLLRLQTLIFLFRFLKEKFSHLTRRYFLTNHLLLQYNNSLRRRVNFPTDYNLLTSRWCGVAFPICRRLVRTNIRYERHWAAALAPVTTAFRFRCYSPQSICFQSPTTVNASFSFRNFTLLEPQKRFGEFGGTWSSTSS